jgi:hypothetical protein
LPYATAHWTNSRPRSGRPTAELDPGPQAYRDRKRNHKVGPYFASEIESYRRAIDKTGRNIALSLSPGRALFLEHLDHLRDNAQMWRVSDDFVGHLGGRRGAVHSHGALAPHQCPGSRADADMLPVGTIAVRAERGSERLSRLTLDEQRTMMTLWCMSRTPLMLGCDLPSSPPETLTLLTNGDLLDVLKDSTANREVLRDAGLVLWTAESTTSADRFVSAFNLGEGNLERAVLPEHRDRSRSRSFGTSHVSHRPATKRPPSKLGSCLLPRLSTH